MAASGTITSVDLTDPTDVQIVGTSTNDEDVVPCDATVVAQDVYGNQSVEQPLLVAGTATSGTFASDPGNASDVSALADGPIVFNVRLTVPATGTVAYATLLATKTPPPSALMGPDRGSLKDLAGAALSAIVNYWPATAPKLPPRRFVSNGTVFWDCEQVAVAVERVFGLDGDLQSEVWQQQPTLIGFRGAILATYLLRCVPEMKESGRNVQFPTADAIDDSADVLLGDAVTVFNTLMTAQANGMLASCSGLAFEDWAPAGPEGGFGGGITRVRVVIL